MLEENTIVVAVSDIRFDELLWLSTEGEVDLAQVIAFPYLDH